MAILLRLVAQVIVEYDLGSVPEDPQIHNAYYQIDTANRKYLPSLFTLPSLDVYVSMVADKINEMMARDYKFVSLIEVISGRYSYLSPHIYHVPADLNISPTVVPGNQYNLRGDFQGAVVNVASLLMDTAQYVETVNGPAQVELIRLLKELFAKLAYVSTDHRKDTADVTLGIVALINTALSKSQEATPTLDTDTIQAAARLDTIVSGINQLLAEMIAQVQRLNS